MNILVWIIHSTASCKKALNTKTPSEHKVHKDKNNNYSNLTLLSLWVLGGFMFEDFFISIPSLEAMESVIIEK